jgi:hypothetical protein
MPQTHHQHSLTTEVESFSGCPPAAEILSQALKDIAKSLILEDFTRKSFKSKDLAG